jgi:hypothetical protein
VRRWSNHIKGIGTLLNNAKNTSSCIRPKSKVWGMADAKSQQTFALLGYPSQSPKYNTTGVWDCAHRVHEQMHLYARSVRINSRTTRCRTLQFAPKLTSLREPWFHIFACQENNARLLM